MNILRVIKLKELNGDFENIGRKEKFFISLFNNLTIEQISNTKYYLLLDDGTCYFHFDFHQKYIRCHEELVMRPIMNKFNMNEKEMKIFIVNTLKYLGLPNHMQLYGHWLM